MKERKTPLSILTREALLRRLPLNHAKSPDIIEDLKIARAGFYGERHLDQQLCYLPENDYSILPDLRIIHQNKPFQIDTLVVTPSFLVIIEAKNIVGTLFFDPSSKQFIRTHDNKESGFPDPIAQVKRQQAQLKDWIKQRQFPPVPIEYLISISQPSTILKTSSNNQELFEYVLHAVHVPEKIQSLKHKYDHKNLLSPNQVQQLIQLLLQEHCPLNLEILKHYRVSRQEITKGIQCPACENYAMLRAIAYWRCPVCLHQSKSAHIQAIKDYHLLIQPTISNRQCRSFLLLESRDVAYHLLSSMNLPATGAGKATVYHRTL